MKMLTSSFEQEGEIFPVALEKLTVELQMVRLCPPLGFFVNLITNSWLYVWPKEIIETNINIESKMYLKYKDPPPHFGIFLQFINLNPVFWGLGIWEFIGNCCLDMGFGLVVMGVVIDKLASNLHGLTNLFQYPYKVLYLYSKNTSNTRYD